MVDIDLTALQLDDFEILLRLACAMLIGAVIGMEREYSHRPAGLRTHMLVALGSCTVMITSQLLFCQYRPYGAAPDPARMSAQVIAGVGFLGAGTILREGIIVKGLTTAASIWAIACLSLAVGAGYYIVGFAGLGFMLVTLTLFERFQEKVFRNRFSQYVVTVKCRNLAAAMEQVTKLIHTYDARLNCMHVEDSGQGSASMAFHTDFAGRHARTRFEIFLKKLTEDPNFISVQSEEKA